MPSFSHALKLNRDYRTRIIQNRCILTFREAHGATCCALVGEVRRGWKVISGLCNGRKMWWPDDALYNAARSTKS